MLGRHLTGHVEHEKHVVEHEDRHACLSSPVHAYNIGYKTSQVIPPKSPQL
jgi:hypothetical protein